MCAHPWLWRNDPGIGGADVLTSYSARGPRMVLRGNLFTTEDPVACGAFESVLSTRGLRTGVTVEDAITQDSRADGGVNAC